MLETALETPEVVEFKAPPLCVGAATVEVPQKAAEVMKIDEKALGLIELFGKKAAPCGRPPDLSKAPVGGSLPPVPPSKAGFSLDNVNTMLEKGGHQPLSASELAIRKVRGDPPPCTIVKGDARSPLPSEIVREDPPPVPKVSCLPSEGAGDVAAGAEDVAAVVSAFLKGRGAASGLLPELSDSEL
jgi:hypothetical protein